MDIAMHMLTVGALIVVAILLKEVARGLGLSTVFAYLLLGLGLSLTQSWLGWLDPATPDHAEFRADRFLAAVDLRDDTPFELAYIVRAVTPGSYHHPAALVEDMYRPALRGTTASGRLIVTP